MPRNTALHCVKNAKLTAWSSLEKITERIVLKISRSLICHPSFPEAAVRAIKVNMEFIPTGDLDLNFELMGNLHQLAIPSPLPPVMTDNLWKHTCFEAFIAVEGEAEYCEFNFSPSGQWAAYAFKNHREPRPWQISKPLSIKTDRTDDRLLLSTTILSADLPPNPAKKLFQMNLTAVIETQDGRHSYWALHHPSPSPDFHDRNGFGQQIEAAFGAGF